MRPVRRIAGIIAAILMILTISHVATTATAEASLATATETNMRSHCGGSTFVQADYGTDTVTSLWTDNPSLSNPPVCEQRAAAICTGPVLVTGPFTTLPWVQTSTVTCPAGTSLVLGGSQVQHLGLSGA